MRLASPSSRTMVARRADVPAEEAECHIVNLLRAPMRALQSARCGALRSVRVEKPLLLVKLQVEPTNPRPNALVGYLPTTRALRSLAPASPRPSALVD